MKNNIPDLNSFDQNIPQNMDCDANSTFKYVKKKKKLPILSFILLSIMSLAVVVGVFFMRNSRDTRSEATVSGPTLTLTPNTISGNVGETRIINIVLNTDIDTVSAADIRIIYDPLAIEVSSFVPGSILPVILSPASISNGNLNATLGSTPIAPYIGTNVLASFTIKILKTGTSPIQFSSHTAVAALNKATNALVAKTGNTVTGISTETTTTTAPVTSAPTSTPTLTSTPSLTSTPISTPTVALVTIPTVDTKNKNIFSPIKNLVSSVKNLFKPSQPSPISKDVYIILDNKCISSTTSPSNMKIFESEKSCLDALDEKTSTKSNEEKSNPAIRKETIDESFSESKQTTGFLSFIQKIIQNLKDFFSSKK